MKHRISVVGSIVIFILLIGLSCSQNGNSPSALSPVPMTAPGTQAPVLTNPQDWAPPVFPGAIPDQEILANMTAVAITPEALDETACDCFGFPVHDAVFHAYHSRADVQDVMDFYSGQMAAEGWKKISIHPADSSLSHQAWQQGVSGPLVAYVMVVPMEDGRTLIYLSIAESDSPRTIIEE